MFNNLNQADMANYCDSSYTLVGSEKDIKALHELMTKTSKEKQNGNWVGHLVQALNNEEIPEHLYVRGWWDDLNCTGDTITFHQESAWEPLYEAWDFIASKFESIAVYFMGEESGCEVFLKRDNGIGEYYPDNYYLDMCGPDGEYCHEYFRTLDEAFRYVERLTDTNIVTIEDLEGLNSAWQEESDDAYIYLHEFTEV